MATSLPVRIAVTVGLLALVAASIDWDAVGDALAGASWGWFAAAVAFLVGSFIVGSERWRLLLAVAEIASPAGRTLRAYFAGSFANNLLPTAFGGDALRAWIVARSGSRLPQALTSVVVDRATALGCGIGLGWLGLAIDPDAVDASHVIPLAAVSAVGLAGAAALISILRRGGLARHLPKRVRPWLGQAAETLRAYLADRRLLVAVVVLGFAFQAITLVATWSVAEALGLDLGLPLLAVVNPLVLIATALPISIGGFGVREGSYVALLAGVGVSSADATLLSLLSATALALASLPGGLVLLLGDEALPSARARARGTGSSAGPGGGTRDPADSRSRR